MQQARLPAVKKEAASVRPGGRLPRRVHQRRDPTVLARTPARPSPFTPRGGQPQLRNHTEVTRRGGLCIFRPWADISFSNVHGWAPTCSIGFRRPRRRTSPIRMWASSVSPAPGFISSTRKPVSSWARSDTATRSPTWNLPPFWSPAELGESLIQAPPLSSLLYRSHRNGFRCNA